MEIIEDLLPSSLPNVPYHPMTPKYITIHNTGNANKGADAKSHARYLKGGAGGRSASWHYTVDDKTIIQHLPDNRSAWHCTDGNGPGNRSSIGIEICENADGDMKKAEDNAIQLINFLMFKHHIPIENVVPHQKWYPAKYCPRKILPRWDQFIEQIKEKGKPKPVVKEAVKVDKSKPSDWAKVDWELGKRNGLHDGERPKDTITREEVNSIVIRALKKAGVVLK